MKENYKYYALLIIIFLLCALAWCRKSNSGEITTIKPDISKEVKKQDSIIYVVKWRDSIRNKLVVKWRYKTDTLHYDTTYVHEIVSICDTLIKTDSTQIADLKSLHSTDSTIIGKQNLKLTEDSLLIVKLDNKFRRWRKVAISEGAFIIAEQGLKVLKP